jgi:hypothetical protein
MNRACGAWIGWGDMLRERGARKRRGAEEVQCVIGINIIQNSTLHYRTL